MPNAGAIDVHCHVYPAPYLQRARELMGSDDLALAEAAAFTLNHPVIRSDPIFIDLKRRVDQMDEAGIRTQLLSFAAPNLLSADEVERSQTARVFNDSALEAARAFPGRFGLLAMLPLPFADAAIAEVERLHAANGVVGWCVSAHYTGRYVDAPEFELLWADLNRRRAVVFVHPDAFSVPKVLADYAMEWMLGAVFDDTITVVRLIMSGLLARHPNIRWIIPHLGGTVANLTDRLDIAWHIDPRLHEQIEQPPTAYLSHLLYDSATALMPTAISRAAESLGITSVMFGSDFPYVHRADLAATRIALDQAELTLEQRSAVESGNFVSACGPYLAPGHREMLGHLSGNSD